MVVNNSYNGQLMVVNIIIDNGYNFITMVNYSFMVVNNMVNVNINSIINTTL
jgi:hypothetical protein